MRGQKEHRDLKKMHLCHFNRVSKDNPEKPVWWCVAQAIKRFNICNGGKPIGEEAI